MLNIQIGDTIKRCKNGSLFIDTHSGRGGKYDIRTSDTNKHKSGAARVYELLRWIAHKEQKNTKEYFGISDQWEKMPKKDVERWQDYHIEKQPPSMYPYILILIACNVNDGLEQLSILPDNYNLPLENKELYKIHPYKVKKLEEHYIKRRYNEGSFSSTSTYTNTTIRIAQRNIQNITNNIKEKNVEELDTKELEPMILNHIYNENNEKLPITKYSKNSKMLLKRNTYNTLQITEPTKMIINNQKLQWKKIFNNDRIIDEYISWDSVQPQNYYPSSSYIFINFMRNIDRLVQYEIQNDEFYHLYQNCNYESNIGYTIGERNISKNILLDIYNNLRNKQIKQEEFYNIEKISPKIEKIRSKQFPNPEYNKIEYKELLNQIKDICNDNIDELNKIHWKEFLQCGNNLQTFHCIALYHRDCFMHIDTQLNTINFPKVIKKIKKFQETTIRSGQNVQECNKIKNDNTILIFMDPSYDSTIEYGKVVWNIIRLQNTYDNVSLMQWYPKIHGDTAATGITSTPIDDKLNIQENMIEKSQKNYLLQHFNNLSKDKCEISLQNSIYQLALSPYRAKEKKITNNFVCDLNIGTTDNTNTMIGSGVQQINVSIEQKSKCEIVVPWLASQLGTVGGGGIGTIQVQN